MRVNAYVLAGDPAWIEQSIASYYALVDRIVVSYDRDGLSWSGSPLSVEESLARLGRADPDRKMMLLPGKFADDSKPRMDLETAQRQAALDAASEGADWVLQLDTDEIALSTTRLRSELDAAESRAARALDFPLRVFYARTPNGRFLEQSGRFWTPQASYPGPIAVAAGTRLTFARQVAGASVNRVDVAAWNTDPVRGYDSPVHAVVSPSEAIVHMSWVRSETQLAEKAIVSGHAGDPHWHATIAAWRRRSRHPLFTVARSPLSRDPLARYRLTRMPRFARTDP
jgi:hypothetical protein